ncbi:MAG: archaellar assembly protein FlaJ [Dehalococcoidia bacterium]|nr:MAG: archaellar assembly protein FlaJ [Dehalococcoidia bacterium]
MNFSTFWLQRRSRESTKKDSIDSEYLSFDLFYQLSYMSSIAAAGISRSQIFEFASKLPCSSSSYFREVHFLAKQMRYDYAVACRTVGEATEAESARSLLLRLASSLGSGEKEADFLAQEAKVQAESFKNQYERGVESLRKWTEAYAALIVSAALIVMVAAISMLIYSVATSFTVSLVGVTICIAIAGSWAIYRVSPKEVRVHTSSSKCAAYSRARWLARILVPAAISGFFITLLTGFGVGWALIIGAILIFPVGIAGVIFDRQIRKKDTDISTFLRSLGNVASAVEITVSNALERLDMRSTATLAKDVKRLHSRLVSRLKPEVCWQRFSLETGSETIYRSVKMFNDAARLGGDPEEVGERSSLLAMTLDFLRAKRNQVSSSFSLLAFAMHAALVALLVFVVQVILLFGDVVEGIYTQGVAEAQAKALEVFSFNFAGIHILETVALPFILLLSVSTAFAVKAADGGNTYKFFGYLAITLGLSGVGLVLVPMVVDNIFTSIPTM